MTTAAHRFPGWIRRKLAGKAAAPEQTDGSRLEGSTTTASGPVDQKPVVVWEALNLLEAEVVKGRLEAAGIPALIRSEALGHIYGLTTGGLAEADVLVPALLAEKALELLSIEPDFDEETDLPASAAP